MDDQFPTLSHVNQQAYFPEAEIGNEPKRSLLRCFGSYEVWEEKEDDDDVDFLMLWIAWKYQNMETYNKSISKLTTWNIIHKLQLLTYCLYMKVKIENSKRTEMAYPMKRHASRTDIIEFQRYNKQGPALNEPIVA